MNRDTLSLALACAGLAACQGNGHGDSACTYGSSDVRVDQAGTGDAVDSEGTLQCVDGKGRIYVVWLDDREGVPDLWLNASADGGVSWKPVAVRVNQDQGDARGAISRPAIGCTDDAVYVAWEDTRDGELSNTNIYLQKSTDLGDAWLPHDVPVDDDPDGVGMSAAPVLATAGSRVYVGWFDGQFGDYDIEVATSDDAGDTWGLPVRVDSDGIGAAYSAWPQLYARTDADILYVTWEDARSGGNDIYFNASDDGGRSFRTDIRVDGGDEPGENNSFAPRIAADGDNVYVVWHDARDAATDDGGRDIFANYSLDGGLDWSSEATLVEDPDNGNTPGFFNSRFPALAVRGNQAVVAWEDARDIGYDIYARRLVNGQPDGPETRLDGGNTTVPSERGAANSLNARVAAAGNTVAVLWTDDRSVADPASGFGDLYYNYSRDFGATWNAEDLRVDNVAPGEAFKLDTNLAVEGDTLYAAWTDGRAGSADIYQHTMKIGEEADYVITSSAACEPGDPTAAP